MIVARYKAVAELPLAVIGLVVAEQFSVAVAKSAKIQCIETTIVPKVLNNGRDHGHGKVFAISVIMDVAIQITVFTM